MTHRVVGLGFGLLFLLVQLGCNDIVTPPPSGGGTGGGGGGIDVCADEGGPIVSILRPTPTDDPSAESVIKVPDISIQCAVESSGQPVDDTSVVITVVGEDGAAVTPSVVNRGDGTFEANANVPNFVNGSLQVACEASNAGGSRAACAGALVDTLLDLGPGIEILNPSASGAVLSGGLEVRYRLSALPVSESDTVLSLPADFQVIVAGQEIASVVESQTDTTATLSAMVDFSDPLLYQTPLDGMYQLSVSSSNGRGVTRTVTLDFTVDADGPGITIDEPEAGSVIGGATDVVATVSDVSGIDPDQVSFYIGSQKFDMSQVSGSPNRFRGSFDANQYSTDVGEVLINVEAIDIVGNKRYATVSVELDGVPPTMELDPDDVREGKEGADGLECSVLFDPLGDNAISDGDVVGPISYLRARIEDQGNPTASYKSGLDPDSAQVWILRGSGVPLIIDTDGNGVCDSINPDVLPGNQAGNIPAVAVDLIAIAPTGSADFLETESFDPLGPYSFCMPGSQTEPGELLCDTAQIPRVIPDNDLADSTIPSIYVKAPIIPYYCLGDPFDWQTSLDFIEGPACMVVRASDVRGNASVSPPIHVCFTNGGGGCVGFISNPDACARDCSGAKFPPNELIGPFD
jgi:hypothetical protein